MNKTTHAEIRIYQDGTSEMTVRLQGETVWRRQGQMTTLFGRERSVITKHLRNVFAEGELERDFFSSMGSRRMSGTTSRRGSWGFINDWRTSCWI